MNYCSIKRRRNWLKTITSDKEVGISNNKGPYDIVQLDSNWTFGCYAFDRNGTDRFGNYIEPVTKEHQKIVQECEFISNIRNLIKYIQHDYNCDAMGQMWNKGPCDCGLREKINRYKKLLKQYQINLIDPNPPTGSK